MREGCRNLLRDEGISGFEPARRAPGKAACSLILGLVLACAPAAVAIYAACGDDEETGTTNTPPPAEAGAGYRGFEPAGQACTSPAQCYINHDAGDGGYVEAGPQIQVQGTGITDHDGGPCADPAGGGRGNTGLTDSDAGGCADPAGRGRRGN